MSGCTVNHHLFTSPFLGTILFEYMLTDFDLGTVWR